jgi:hypothetical protein
VIPKNLCSNPEVELRRRNLSCGIDRNEKLWEFGFVHWFERKGDVDASVSDSDCDDDDCDVERDRGIERHEKPIEDSVRRKGDEELFELRPFVPEELEVALQSEGGRT